MRKSSASVCAVAGCNNSSRKKNGRNDLSFHRFPKNPGVRAQWIYACGRSDKWNPDISCICSDHFKPSDFKRNLRAELLNYTPKQRFLEEFAVPTEELPMGISELKILYEAKKLEKEQSEMGRKCCVPGCKSNYDSTLRLTSPGLRRNVSTFTFPKDEESRNAWIRAIGREDWIPSPFSVVCKKHFDPKDIIYDEFWRQPDDSVTLLPLTRPKLVAGAIPCRFRELTPDLPTLTVLNVENVNMPENCYISDSSNVTNEAVNLEMLAGCYENSEMSAECDVEYLGMVPSNEIQNVSDEESPVQKLSSLDLEELWKDDNGSVCRLCANSDPNCVSLFKEMKLDINLKADIQNFLQLKVQEDDELPDTVCPSCVAALTAWREFFHSCSEAEKQLQNTLESKKKALFSSPDVNPDKTEAMDETVDSNPTLGIKRSLSNENSCAEDSEEPDIIFVSEKRNTDVRNPNKKIRVKTYEELASDSNCQNPPPGNSKTMPVKCGICMKEFRDYVSVANHIIARHNVGPNQCRYCFATFKGFTTFKIHERQCKLDRLNELEKSSKNELERSSKRQQILSSKKLDSSSKLGLICVKVFPDGKTKEVLKPGMDRLNDCERMPDDHVSSSKERSNTKISNSKQSSKEKTSSSKMVSENGKRKVNTKTATKTPPSKTPSSQPYECYLCNKNFTTASHLSEHLASHIQPVNTS